MQVNNAARVAIDDGLGHSPKEAREHNEVDTIPLKGMQRGGAEVGAAGDVHGRNAVLFGAL